MELMKCSEMRRSSCKSNDTLVNKKTLIMVNLMLHRVLMYTFDQWIPGPHAAGSNSNSNYAALEESEARRRCDGPKVGRNTELFCFLTIGMSCGLASMSLCSNSMSDGVDARANIMLP